MNNTLEAGSSRLTHNNSFDGSLGGSSNQSSESQGSIYKIGDLAREFSVTLRTLRFYEDRGLVNPTRSGTTRLYSANDRERLRIALFCKRIGLSLGDIRKVLDLHEFDGDDSDADLQIRDVYAFQLKELEQQLEETRMTINDLQQQLEAMDKLA